MKSFVKLLSVILSICIIAGSASVISSAAEKSISFTVTTDTHLQAKANSSVPEQNAESEVNTEGMIDKDIFYYAAQQGQMNYESTAIIKSMLRNFEESDDEILLIAGDLTDGKRNSHLEMAQLLKETEQRSGKRILITVGNHDCDEKSDDVYIDINEFKEIYHDFGFDEAADTLDGTASYTAELSDGYRLIAIDSCIYGKDDGEINSKTLDWIKAEAEKAKADGVIPVAMMHHSILPHYYVQPMIGGYSSTADKLADMGINFVLTGHIHANDISSAVSKKGNMIYDVQTGSLITAPNAYKRVTLTGTKADIKTDYVTEIDTNDLPGGYSDAQLARINEDFSKYSEDFFEAGVCRWLNRYIGSADKLGKTLKLEKGSWAFNVLDKLLRNIGNALNTPIYDDGSTPGTADSIEEIAANAGFEIPASRYAMPYQAAARIMSAFFFGDEEKQLAGGETELLFACLKAVLAQALTDIAVKDAAELLFSVTGINIRDAIVGAKAKFYYSDLLAARLAEALILTLTDGLTSDLSAPSDLETSFDFAVRASEELVPLGFFEKILNFFRMLLAALGLIKA